MAHPLALEGFFTCCAAVCYLTVSKGSRLRWGLAAGIALAVFPLAIASTLVMHQTHANGVWSTELGWPLSLCHGFREYQEAASTYPVADGLNNPFSPSAQRQLHACTQDIDWHTAAADSLFNASILFLLAGGAFIFRTRPLTQTP